MLKYENNMPRNVFINYLNEIYLKINYQVNISFNDTKKYIYL